MYSSKDLQIEILIVLLRLYQDKVIDDKVLNHYRRSFLRPCVDKLYFFNMLQELKDIHTTWFKNYVPLGRDRNVK